MPWCENEDCGKRDLKKEDIVFDEQHHQILCVPCAQVRAESQPVLMGELVDKTHFGIQYTSDNGIHAEVIHGGVKFEASVTNDQLKKIFTNKGKSLLG